MKHFGRFNKSVHGFYGIYDYLYLELDEDKMILTQGSVHLIKGQNFRNP